MLLESLALVPSEKRDDAVAALVEALLLFEREHLLAHLRFPQLDQLVRRDEVLLFKELLGGEEAGLVDEDGALVLADRVDERTNGLGGALDDLFERGDALQKVLVERYVVLFFVVLVLILLERVDAREHEEFVLTAGAILPFVVVEGTAGLAEHVDGAD